MVFMERCSSKSHSFASHAYTRGKVIGCPFIIVAISHKDREIYM